jgi:hypothetical protein
LIKDLLKKTKTSNADEECFSINSDSEKSSVDFYGTPPRHLINNSDSNPDNLNNLLTKSKEYALLQSEILQLIPLLLNFVIDYNLQFEENVYNKLSETNDITSFVRSGPKDQSILSWGSNYSNLQKNILKSNFKDFKEYFNKNSLNRKKIISKLIKAKFEKCDEIVKDHINNDASKELLMFLYFYFSLFFNKFNSNFEKQNLSNDKIKKNLDLLLLTLLSKLIESS